MSVRTIERVGTTELVKKSVEGSKPLPRIQDLEDLESFTDILSGFQYLALYQIFKEIQIWDSSTWETKNLLAPILSFDYDELQRPFLVFPYFEPLTTEEEANKLTFADARDKILSFLESKGINHSKAYDFIRRVRLFCNEWNLNEEDILFNLNNLGWNDTFGIRILDYGLTEDLVQDYLERY